MKAAVYYETGGPEVFRYEDVPDPLCDASGVVMVLNHQRVHAMIQRHLDDVARGALQIVVDRTFPLAKRRRRTRSSRAGRPFGESC